MPVVFALRGELRSDGGDVAEAAGVEDDGDFLDAETSLGTHMSVCGCFFAGAMIWTYLVSGKKR